MLRIGIVATVGVSALLGLSTNSPALLLLILLAMCGLGLAAVVAGVHLRTSAPSRALSLLTILPALVMLGLFYSLAVHMHRSLGSWPRYIDMHGFSPSLRAHAELATGCFGVLLLINLVVFPVVLPGVLLLCFIDRRLRGGLFYVGLYALSFAVAFELMLLAPPPFLNWLWD